MKEKSKYARKKSAFEWVINTVVIMYISVYMRLEHLTNYVETLKLLKNYFFLTFVELSNNVYNIIDNFNFIYFFVKLRLD